MRPRWHKVLADLWSNKARSLLVIASITVGLFAIGMISTLHSLLLQDMGDSYQNIHPANLIVKSAGFDQDWVDHIAKLPGIQRAEGAFYYPLRLEVGQDEYIGLDVRAYSDYADMQINQVTLLEGKWPPADQEIVIEKNKLSDTKAQVGDDIVIKLPSGDTHTLKLVGVVQDLSIGSDSAGGGFFLAPTQGYVSESAIESMGLPITYSYLYAIVSELPEDLAHIQSVLDTVLVEFDHQGIQVAASYSRRNTDHPLIIYLNALAGVLFVLGFLVVFLSAFLIANTLSALLTQQIVQVGVMKTIGGTGRQISGIYMVLILVFSLISLIFAVPLANLAAWMENRFLAESINFIAGSHRFVPQAVLLQLVVALVIPQLVGAFPVIQGTRISIQDALNGSVSKVDDQGRIYRLLSHVRGFSRPLLISLRNTFRRRGRLILTLITLILGGAIFIATFNVRGSLDQNIELLGKYFMSDVNLTLDRPYRLEEVQGVAAELPEVVYIEGWASARAEMVRSDDLQGEIVSLVGPPGDSTLIEPMVLQGRWILAGDENAIVLSELFLEQYPEFKIGDTLHLKVNGDKTRWVIVGFFQFAGKNVGLMAYTNYDYLSRLTHTSGRSAVYRVSAAEGWHTQEKQKELAVKLEKHFNDAGYRVSDVRSGKSIQSYTSQGLNTLTTFLMIMAILMALVGSIGLTGTMGLNVMDRTREIGIMRAIGAANGTLMRMVIVEGILIGVISWFLACFAAIPISSVMSDVISTAIFGNPIQLTFSVPGVLIWLVLVILLSAFASILPARNAARLTIREVLSYE